LKPFAEFGSAGTLLIPWDAAARTHRFKDRPLAWPGLMEEIGRLARESRHGIVLQPRMRNARRNAVYGNFDLCNLRIVTAIPPDGEPEGLGAFMRMPSLLTTTGHDRNVLFANVDIASGRMCTGRLREIKLGEHYLHPETRAPIG